ncbi:peptidyl-tRNA hydrolase PTH2-domain-containing protein [Lineolata rhizophorae]|uniref:peptidyl-tRNA hydrolase n=1 Tax=Lineolata rhizophorae TaxID=578093 RepID=A0A6A6P9B2_9PEZI|nr:peptidyl-tRNA hydrolase PTH2-domain-containing protein [Lineolata rhizophorae]
MASIQDRPPPSALALAVAAAIVAGIGGYFLGQASSLGLFGNSKSSRAAKQTQPASSSEGESEGEEAQADIADFSSNREECKLVLVVRSDLGMTKGKIAAQCSHATLACYKTILRKAPSSPFLARWERYGQMKVALQVKSEEELEVLQAQALSLGLVAQIIHDAGRTQIASGSATVLGIGPAPKSIVDSVTGHLKLL